MKLKDIKKVIKDTNTKAGKQHINDIARNEAIVTTSRRHTDLLNGTILNNYKAKNELTIRQLADKVPTVSRAMVGKLVKLGQAVIDEDTETVNNHLENGWAKGKSSKSKSVSLDVIKKSLNHYHKNERTADIKAVQTLCNKLLK